MNLTFLNGAFLFAALAALLPLLIHLISRRRVATVDFSSLRFLKELERKRIRRVRLRQILLLVVRSLIILCVALALARPTLRGTMGGERGHAKTSMAIVLDTSASMTRSVDGGDILSASLGDAIDIAGLMEDGDQVFLVTASRPVRSLIDGGTFSPDVVTGLMDEIGTTFASTDYTRAVELASTLLEDARNLNREMYVLGDMQASGWVPDAAGPREPAETAGSERVYIVSRAGPEANLSMDSVDVERRYGGGPGQYSVTARVSNHGRRSGEVLVRVYVDDEQVGQAGIEVERGGSAVARFVVSAEESSLHGGRVELPADAFEPDNSRYFVIPTVSRTEVLLVGPAPAGGTGGNELDDADYIERALDPTGKSERFSVRRVYGDALGEQDRGRFPVVVLADVGRLDSASELWLKDHVDRGGGVLLVLGNRTDIRFWNGGALRELAGVEVLAPAERRDGVRLAPSGRGHPLLEGLVSGERLIDDVEVRRALVVASEDAEEVLEMPGVGPALLIGRAASGGQVAVLAIGVDPSWSDLPRSGFVVPLLHRLVDRLARSSDVAPSVTVGSDLEVDLPGGTSGSVDVTTPDGEDVAAELVDAAGRAAVLRSAGVPGIYRFSRSGRLVAMGAVNLDPAESDLTPATGEAIVSSVAPREAAVVQSGTDLADQVLQARYGRELWRLLLYAALALFAFEMFLARPRYA